jgi:cytoskeletal protein CcmA (bactofilin family)
MNESDRETPSAPEGSPVVIGSGARFEGLLSFWGSARVEGTMRGEVQADGLLEVGPDAKLEAHVEVDVLVVEGLVEGDVVARERVEIRDGGRVCAAIATPRLVLSEGGVLDGRLTMTARTAAADPHASSSASAA